MSMLLALSLLATVPHFNGQKDFAPTVYYLASDRLQGRRAGTPWADTAAFWLARKLDSLGYEPLFQGSFFQTFTVQQVEGYDSLETQAFLIVGKDTTPLKVGEDFVPISFSSSGEVEAPLLFVGYGITSLKYHYDDYHGSDATGKVVVVLRHEPREKDSVGVFGTRFPSIYSDIRYKAKNAKEHGAKAMILVNDPVPHPHEPDELMRFRREASVQDVGILAVHMKRTVLARLFPFDSLQRAIDEDLNPHPVEPPNAKILLRIKIIRTEKENRNVAGLLRGTDPVLSQKYIIFGAHYDHLGWGGPGSGALDPEVHAVHNGADDNASGVAMVLAIARYLKQYPPHHSVIIAFWGAEEIGALGSAAFVKNPPVPLSNVLIYFNFDMVGRLNEKGELTLTGTGTAKELEGILDRLKAETQDLTLIYSPEGFGGSDHMNFTLEHVPVLFYFTGVHEDYHRATDDPEKINYEGMAKVADFAWRVFEAVDTLESLTFQELAAASPAAGIQTGDVRRGVRLGVIPDYAFQGKGMRLSGVRPNGPGGKAGLKKGDIIVEINGKPIDDIYAYMYALQEVQWGDTLQVKVKRGDRLLTLQVPLVKE